MHRSSTRPARHAAVLAVLAVLWVPAAGQLAAQDARLSTRAAPSDSATRSDSALAAEFATQIAQKRAVDDVFTRTLGGEMVVRKIAYVVDDGTTIPAYLFAPSDSGRRYPTILFVHGGLHGDFGLAHLAQVRALVRAGYVVAAPEYRGSTGYGRAFYEAIDYGGREVDDVLAARDYLQRFVPQADLGHMAIMGYSHGGYIALLAVVRHPELFRVAVAHVPVADLPTRMRTHPPWYEAEFVGQPSYGSPLHDDPLPYLARSPTMHASELRVPVLVHAADNDRDVFIEENRLLRDAMHAAGKDAAGLYTYREFHNPPGGHSFGIVDTPQGRSSWRETMEFLARRIGDGAAPGDTGGLTIRAAQLIDGRGGVLHDVVVTVREGRIARVDTGAAARQIARPSYDLGARTLMPGLIDAHVHLGWWFDRDSVLQVGIDRRAPEVALRAIAANARAMLLAGFTTVQSVGGPEDGSIRDAIARGDLPGPRVLTSLDPILDPRLTPDELRESVRQHRARGADLIKLFASGGLGATAEPQTLSDAQLAATCGEAHVVGWRTVVHAMTAQSVRAATLAGCTEIEHGLQATDADLQRLASSHTIFGPQVCLVFQNYLDHRRVFGRSGFPPESFAVLADALPQARALFRRALAVPGLDIVLSSDAVAGAHGRNAEELVCRVTEAGQPPMDALVSATSRAARALGLGDRTGAVVPGLDADLIDVDGDPLRDITVLRRPTFVMRAGRVYREP